MSGILEQLQQANFDRNKLWDPKNQLDGLFFATELGGECGEAQNVVKKLEREARGIAGSRDTVEHLGQELADVIICVSLVANYYGIDLCAEIAPKFNATSDKLGFPIRIEHP